MSKSYRQGVTHIINLNISRLPREVAGARPTDEHKYHKKLIHHDTNDYRFNLYAFDAPEQHLFIKSFTVYPIYLITLYAEAYVEIWTTRVSQWFHEFWCHV